MTARSPSLDAMNDSRGPGPHPLRSSGDSASAGPPTRVALVDDHEMLCEALAHVMNQQADLEVVGVAHDLLGARRLLERADADVVLLDHRLPDGNGVAAIPGLRALRRGAAFVVLTATANDDLLEQALRNGAVGVISKARGLDEVTEAVRATAAGQVVVLPDPGAGPATYRDAPPRPAPVGPDLTGREREVLGYLADGLSNAEIAQRMVVSVHTVRNHVANLTAKLGARSRLEALAIAVRQGLLPER